MYRKKGINSTFPERFVKKVKVKSREEPPCLPAPCLKEKKVSNLSSKSVTKRKMVTVFQFLLQKVYKKEVTVFHSKVKFELKKCKKKEREKEWLPSSTLGQSSMLSENFKVPST